MVAGTKTQDPSPFELDYLDDYEGVERFVQFAERELRVPKGTGAGDLMHIAGFQCEIAERILFSGNPNLRTVGICIGRGNGKTTLIAALSIYVLVTGDMGTSVVNVASDQRQAALLFDTARRMVQLNPMLDARIGVWRDRMEIDRLGSTFNCLPSTPATLEGLDPTLAILDEAGVAARETYEVLTLAQGKRVESKLVCIGTPGPREEQVLLDLKKAHEADPEDDTLDWIEYTASGFEDHPPLCEHCIRLANPAVEAGFLHLSAFRAVAPPKTREATYRRARLTQWVSEHEGSLFPPGLWASLADPDRRIKKTDRVVLALDGSMSDDTTALLAATVDAEPHLEVIGVWSRPSDASKEWRVPVLEVEQAIRDACKRYKVVELAADPYLWVRSLQTLESEGVPVVVFSQSVSRLTAATGSFFQAVHAGKLSHSGNADLAAHIGNAVVQDTDRGIRLVKSSRSRHARKIDLAVAAVMAHSRATWRARRKSKARSFS